MDHTEGASFNNHTWSIVQLFNLLADWLVTVRGCQHAITVISVAITSTDWLIVILLHAHGTGHKPLAWTFMQHCDLKRICGLPALDENCYTSSEIGLPQFSDCIQHRSGYVWPSLPHTSSVVMLNGQSTHGSVSCSHSPTWFNNMAGSSQVALSSSHWLLYVWLFVAHLGSYHDGHSL